MFFLVFQPQLQAQEPDNGPNVELVVLGTMQDGGFPHIGCDKDCCRNIFLRPAQARKVVCLGLIDHRDSSMWIFEATPDFPVQLKTLKNLSNNSDEMPDGVFLTHAHIGHYTGLMFLGKEATNASKTQVYAMPRMAEFLIENGPWSLLRDNQNIDIQYLADEQTVLLKEDISVTPIRVPHRDEFSETVGFRISGPNKTALFIPDIDKWDLWEHNIVEEISRVDYAFLDATFYDAAEVNFRDIAEIPHPFVIESMALFSGLPNREKAKVHFIHFNHTNAVKDPSSEEGQTVINAQFKISEEGLKLGM